jgi:hypothetical protein
MAKKTDFINIDAAAELMDTSVQTARQVLNWFGVNTIEGKKALNPQGVAFGKSPKLYEVAGIQTLLAQKAEING